MPTAIGLSILLLLAGCGGSDSNNDGDPPQVTLQAGSNEPYALQPLRSAWPPLDTNDAEKIALDEVSAANYYLVLDGSGSMLDAGYSNNRSKIDVAREAIAQFVNNVPASAKLGLFVFDSYGESERVPLALHNRDTVAQVLADTNAGGGTPLRTAISAGYEKLTSEAMRQLGYGEYHLVVITDGMPSGWNESPDEIMQTIRRDSPVVVHTIGFCIGTDHVLNQPGMAYYVAADSPQQLASGLDSVLAESNEFDIANFDAAAGNMK